MKKTYQMLDLDCANCAAKMEDAIRKLRRRQECHRQLYDPEADHRGGRRPL